MEDPADARPDLPSARLNATERADEGKGLMNFQSEMARKLALAVSAIMCLAAIYDVRFLVDDGTEIQAGSYFAGFGSSWFNGLMLSIDRILLPLAAMAINLLLARHLFDWARDIGKGPRPTLQPFLYRIVLLVGAATIISVSIGIVLNLSLMPLTYSTYAGSSADTAVRVSALGEMLVGSLGALIPQAVWIAVGIILVREGRKTLNLAAIQFELAEPDAAI